MFGEKPAKNAPPPPGLRHTGRRLDLMICGCITCVHWCRDNVCCEWQYKLPRVHVYRKNCHRNHLRTKMYLKINLGCSVLLVSINNDMSIRYNISQ